MFTGDTHGTPTMLYCLCAICITGAHSFLTEKNVFFEVIFPFSTITYIFDCDFEFHLPWPPMKVYAPLMVAANVLKLLDEINMLLYTYLAVLIPPMQLEKANKSSLSSYNFEQYLMDSSYMNFGYAFNEKSEGIQDEILKGVKNRCKEFLVEICKQIPERIPNNMTILENCKLLSPINATNQIKPDITNLAKSFKTVCSDVDSVMQEWNSIHRTN